MTTNKVHDPNNGNCPKTIIGDCGYEKCNPDVHPCTCEKQQQAPKEYKIFLAVYLTLACIWIVFMIFYIQDSIKIPIKHYLDHVQVSEVDMSGAIYTTAYNVDINDPVVEFFKSCDGKIIHYREDINAYGSTTARAECNSPNNRF